MYASRELTIAIDKLKSASDLTIEGANTDKMTIKGTSDGRVLELIVGVSHNGIDLVLKGFTPSITAEIKVDGASAIRGGIDNDDLDILKKGVSRLEEQVSKLRQQAGADAYDFLR